MMRSRMLTSKSYQRVSLSSPEGAGPMTHDAKRTPPPAQLTFPAQLADSWRDDARILRSRGAPGHADVLESCAQELQARQEEHFLEALPLSQAAKEVGYSYSALQKVVAEGKNPNVGKRNAPRIRRGDLPQKAGRLSGGPVDNQSDLAERFMRRDG